MIMCVRLVDHQASTHGQEGFFFAALAGLPS